MKWYTFITNYAKPKPKPLAGKNPHIEAYIIMIIIIIIIITALCYASTHMLNICGII